MLSTFNNNIQGYNALRFEPGKDNLFSMRDDNEHMKLRNKMAPGVSLSVSEYTPNLLGQFPTACWFLSYQESVTVCYVTLGLAALLNRF